MSSDDKGNLAGGDPTQREPGLVSRLLLRVMGPAEVVTPDEDDVREQQAWADKQAGGHAEPHPPLDRAIADPHSLESATPRREATEISTGGRTSGGPPVGPPAFEGPSVEGPAVDAPAASDDRTPPAP